MYGGWLLGCTWSKLSLTANALSPYRVTQVLRLSNIYTVYFSGEFTTADSEDCVVHADSEDCAFQYNDSIHIFSIAIFSMQRHLNY